MNAFRIFSSLLAFFYISLLTLTGQGLLTYEIVQHDDGSGNGVVIMYNHHEPNPNFTCQGDLYAGLNPSSNNHLGSFTYVLLEGRFESFGITQLSAGTYTFLLGCPDINTVVRFQISLVGCTDPEATNYNPEASIDDGSCTYSNSQCPEITSVVTSEPSCGESNGSILAYASGSNKQYKLNQGSWRSSGFFGNLGQGSFTVSVRNSSTGCSDSRSVSLTCGEDNSCPSLQSVQVGQYPSTCSSTDAWITVHASGGNNEYSKDGGITWQGWATFSGLTAGTYDLRVRNVDLGCEFSTSITIPCSPSCSDGRRNGGETGVDCGGPCVPCCPEITNIRVDKYPYCSSSTGGSIAIAARGKDLKYSITGGGPYQSSPVFTNVPAGTYNISVQSTSTRCVENSTFELICVDECPIITTVTTSEANCEVVNSGLITIGLSAGQGNAGGSKPGGPDDRSGGSTYEYSIDNGNTWSSRGTFSVSAGEYSVLVRNNETGCLRGQSGILVGCHSCWDGIKNGNETEIDCGGDCHTCDCPSVEDIKASITALNDPRGGSGGGIFGGSNEPKMFICDIEENYDCPSCISYRSCHDERDNDGDDLCDCEDPDCDTWFDEVCVKPKEACEDGIDNDNDGSIDCADGDCASTQFCDFTNDLGKSSETSTILDELGKLLLLSDTKDDFIRELGIPIWNNSFFRGDYLIVPVAKINSYKISAIIIVHKASNDDINFNLITKEQIISTISPKLGDDIKNPEQPIWQNDSYSLEDAITFFVMADQKYFGYLDGDISHYLNKAPRTQNSGKSPEQCDDYCTLVCTEAELRYADGTIVVSDQFGKRTGRDENGNVTSLPNLDGTNYNSNGSVLIGFTCRALIEICVTIPCPTETSGNTQINYSPTGGTSNTNSGSSEFNSRIVNCNQGGGVNDPPHDGGEASSNEAFCDAITRIMSTCVGSAGTGLAEPGKRHLLEIIDMIPDCDNSGSLDDEGNLSEVADFICAGGANDVNIQIVSDYVTYIKMSPNGETVCFEDYMEAQRILDLYELDLTASEMFETYDVAECFGRADAEACILRKIADDVAWKPPVDIQDLCLPLLTEIGDGLYVNFVNLDYNFRHENTGISVNSIIFNLCIQFPAEMSDNTRNRKFNNAMDNAINSTEAYLEIFWRDNPLVEPLSLNLIWKRNVRTAILSQFGSSASISSNCAGVPPTPALWTC